MYKLLLIDDEPDILKGMAKGIPWNQWGFTVSGQAFNGLEAMELIRREPPHVVLSDIRMPHMDGIALMENLNRDYPEIKIIILSGYNDFEYLKEAIKNRAVEYLLKPTDLEEFETVFMKTRELLDKEQEQEGEIEDLRNQAKAGKDFQFIRIFNDLIRGYVYDEYHFFMEALGILFQNCVMVVFDLHFERQQEGGPERLSDLQRTMAAYCNTRKTEFRTYFCMDFSNQLTAVIEIPKEETEWKCAVLTFLQELQSEVQERYHVLLYAGVSDICGQVSRLYGGYGQAVKCVRQKMFFDPLSIVFYPDLDLYGNTVQIVKDYIDQEYCSNFISLDYAAEKVNKNAAYLSKLFKRETGYNFSDYIMQKRMEKSRELLLDHSLKIYQIAEMTGYADGSNFIKVFKKYYGVSPNEYRKLTFYADR